MLQNLRQLPIDELKEIINAIKSLEPILNYLEHIEYLELQIKYCQKDLDQEAKREFQDSYIS